MKYLVQLNNGFEGDENTLTKGFDNLEDAKEYAKKECEVYYKIAEGDFFLDEESFWEGSGKVILTNCNDTSMTWFYSWTADFCEVENL